MKSYINPQPHAVDRKNKNENKSSDKDGLQSNKDNKSSKEIYQNEPEEQAWEEALEKVNPKHNLKDD